MNPYTTAEIAQAWDDKTTLELWCRVETALLQAQAELGLIPSEWAHQAERTPPPTVDAWHAATTDTGHEIVGYLQAWGVPHVHIGITSSDLIDTANALRYKQINDTLETDTYRLREALIELALKNLQQPRVGRTHGQPAVTTTLGHKIADLAHQAHRGARRLTQARADIELGMLNGPTGGYHHITPETERLALAKLGLKPHPATTQIAPRDSLTHYTATLIGIVQTCAALATELRLSQHHQISELHSTDNAPHYQGSSSMPNKQNPTRAERITGLARIARQTYPAIAESTEQWHERDISQSSVERTLMPQLTGISHYSIQWATEAARTLQVNNTHIAYHYANHWAPLNSHSEMYLAQIEGKPYDEARQQTPEQQTPVEADSQHTHLQLLKIGSRP